MFAKDSFEFSSFSISSAFTLSSLLRQLLNILDIGTFMLGDTWLWAQDLALDKQVLYSLSHNFSYFPDRDFWVFLSYTPTCPAICWNGDFHNFFPELASNCHHPDLHLLSTWICRIETPHAAYRNYIFKIMKVPTCPFTGALQHLCILIVQVLDFPSPLCGFCVLGLSLYSSQLLALCSLLSLPPFPS